MISIIPQQLPTAQDSDPDMDEALRRVRQRPAPQPVSALPEAEATEASVLLGLEVDFLPTMGCGTCNGWGTIVKNGTSKPCPTCRPSGLAEQR